ncbi:hypothetical protein ACLX1H_008998 [Fusarium chlamydosporum]
MAAAIIKKADVNKRDKDGSHPLTWAIRENIDEAPPPPHFTSQKLSLHQCHKRLIPLLLEKKELDVERIESDGESPFFAVIDGGNSLLLKPRNLMPSFAEPQWYEVQKRKEGINVLILKDLLSSGRFNVNILNDDSRSPLSLAVERSSLRVVQTLLDSPNIKVCSQDKDGRTPLIWSILGNRADTMEAILAQDDSGVDTPDRSGRKPLSWASEKADLKMVRSLVQKCGDNVDTPDCNGRSPLSWAVQTEREPALTSGAFENNQLAFDGQAQGEPPIIRFLIDTCGADPNSKDNDERTPLSWAATTKNPSIVKYMAQKAENVNEPDKGGRSPLSWSAEQGTLHVVRYLLSHESINVNIEDCNGQTPLSWATRQHNKDMIVLFLQKDTGTLHSMARRATDIDKIKLLLEAGYDASKRNSRGESPLHRAVEAGNLEIAELLINHCPDKECPPPWAKETLFGFEPEVHDDMLHVKVRLEGSPHNGTAKTIISMATSFPASFEPLNSTLSSRSDMREIISGVAIQAMVGPSMASPASFFSTLPRSIIPDDGMEFILQFLNTLEMRWDHRLKQAENNARSF